MILTAVDNPKYRIFFKTLAYTGARPCEAVNLKPENIDFKNKCIYVYVAKKHSPIRLPKYFPKCLELELKLWIKSRSKEITKHHNYVFFNRQTKNHISVTEASKVFRETLDKCGLDRYYTIADDKNNPKIKDHRKLRNYTLKSLRKYFESKVYDFSGDGLMSSRLLHHESINTTNKYYLAISKEKKKEVVDKAFNEKQKIKKSL